jgi:molecular chaperone GrpE
MGTADMDEEKNSDTSAEAEENDREKELLAELAQKNRQLDEYLNGLRYLQADFENYKKRVAREKEEYTKFANESLIKELIDAYENLERAIEISKKSSDGNMTKGLEMVYSNMKSVFEKHGLKPIVSVGEKFSPYLHEAVMQELTNDHEEDIILEEFQRGYMLNSKVIRYSKVKVSKRC